MTGKSIRQIINLIHIKIISLSTYNLNIEDYTVLNWGHAVAQLVEALRYKSEGRGFDSR